MNTKINPMPLKTSKEWSEQREYKNIVILDPDGWDRKNYQYSFYEEMITEGEFYKRLSYSTIRRDIRDDELTIEDIVEEYRFDEIAEHYDDFDIEKYIKYRYKLDDLAQLYSWELDSFVVSQSEHYIDEIVEQYTDKVTSALDNYNKPDNSSLGLFRYTDAKDLFHTVGDRIGYHKLYDILQTLSNC